MRTWILLVAAGLLVVGATQAVRTWGPREDCPGHWHASFLVFVDGHQVGFQAPVFLRGPGGIKDYDLHADDQIMHFHPQYDKVRCTPVRAFLGNLGIRLTDSSISFNENFGANAGTYHENSTHSLQVHLKPWGEPWRSVPWSSIDQRQLRPGEKLLVTFGALTDDQVEQQRAQVRDVPDQYLPLALRAGSRPSGGDEHASTAPPV